MFENRFNRVHRIVRFYYLSLPATWILNFLLNFLLWVRVQKNRFSNKKIEALDESECEAILKNACGWEKIDRPVKDRPYDERVFLSVIIPAYNAAQYIAECIDSILAQETQYPFEIIVIDDGSSDDTLTILSRYAGKENITVIPQNNGGVASARNRGLELARGRYFMFVDSDDRLPSGVIQDFVSEAENTGVDIVEGNYMIQRDSSPWELGRPLWRRRKEVDMQRNPRWVPKIYGFPWGRIYARHLWDGVEFPMGIDFEDTIITFIIFKRARHYIYIPKPMYIYRIHDSSISQKICGSYKALDAYFVILLILEQYQRLKLHYDAAFYEMVLHHMGLILYVRTMGLDDKTLDALMTLCRKVLMGIDYVAPKDMSYYDQCVRKSILGLNRGMWESICSSL